MKLLCNQAVRSSYGTMLRYLWVSILIVATPLAYCKMQLRGPEGEPTFTPQGLYFKMDGDQIQVLSIACGTIRHSENPGAIQCLFVHQLRINRDLTFSGKRIEITERWGIVDSDTDELLLTQTAFLRYHVEIKKGDAWSVDELSRPIVDREVRGDDRFLLLQYADGCLQSDGECWQRSDGNLVMPSDSRAADSEAQQALFAPFKEQKFNLGFSPALTFFLSKGFAIEGKEITLHSPKCKDIGAKIRASGGGYVLLEQNTSRAAARMDSCGPAFTAIPDTKPKWTLAEMYSLRTGLDTPIEEIQDGKLSEKEKRRAEIRERIKRGEEVSKEELLEVLGEK